MNERHNLKYKKALILGGTGLVGSAVCRRLASAGFEELILVSLKDSAAEGQFRKLKQQLGKTRLILEAGNILHPTPLRNVSFDPLKHSSANLASLESFLLEPLNKKTVRGWFFFRLIEKYRPDAVIDCVNIANQLSYNELPSANSPLQILIRFVQIFYQTVNHFPDTVKHYIKVGTTGTGGMGFNIPYTHGEIQPSEQLLSKSAVAGAFSQLLFLLSRTPKMPIISEIKPAAAIAWGKIGFGPIQKGKHNLYLDKNYHEITLGGNKEKDFEINNSLKSDQIMESVFVDSGENGLFSLEEFRTITSMDQMEYVRPEEIAELVYLELTGKRTGRDIVAALEGAVLNPSYEAGYLRGSVINQLEQLAAAHHQPSVAFELLGPPRLSKLLFEAYLILQFYPSENLAQLIEQNLRQNRFLLLSIISTGIPILLPDGKTLLRGSLIKVKPNKKENVGVIADQGWIDLRETNLKIWAGRIKSYQNINGADKCSPGELVSYIFKTELGGYR